MITSIIIDYEQHCINRLESLLAENCRDVVELKGSFQLVVIPEIRDDIKRQYGVPEEGFESFLKEHFFDLRYQEKPEIMTILTADL